MDYSTTMTILVPKDKKNKFRRVCDQYNTDWQAVAHTQTLPLVVREEKYKGTQSLYLEDGLHWWRMEVCALSVTLTLPKIGLYLPLAWEEVHEGIITTHFIGGEVAREAGTLTCSLCGRSVAQGYRLLQEEAAEILFVSGRCLEKVGLSELKPKLFPWVGERYSYWHYLPPQATATEVISTEAALTVGLPLVQAYGYERVGQEPCTRDLVLRMLQEETPEAIAYRSTIDFTQGEQLRKDLLALFAERSQQKLPNDWVYNVLTCLEQEWIPLSRLGTLVSALCVMTSRKKGAGGEASKDERTAAVA